MRILFIILITFSATLSIKAQDVYIFTQSVSAYWNAAGNWVCPGGTTCPPTTIPASDTVKISGTCRLNSGLTITNNGVVQVQSGATLSMEEIGWFNNHGDLNIEQGAMSDNDDGGVFRMYNGSNLNLDGDMSIFDDFGGDLLILTGSNVNVGPTGTLTYY